MSATPSSSPDAETVWQDLSDRLPASTGWMHSGVAVLDGGSIVCAHPAGGSLLFIGMDGSVQEVPTELTEMHAIVQTVAEERERLWIADNGHMFVPDKGEYVGLEARGRVALLDLDGSVAQELACPKLPAYANSAWSPTAVAVDDRSRTPSGNVWVADGYGQSLVHQFQADGTYIRTLDGSDSGLSFACPHGLYLRPSGDGVEVYIADRTNHRLVVYSTSGEYLRAFGANDLDSPSAMVSAGDHLFVTELFGGVSYFENDTFAGTLENARSRSHTEQDWPNIRNSGNEIVAPARPEKSFNAPHGITYRDDWLYLTEWVVGGRLLRIQPAILRNRRQT